MNATLPALSLRQPWAHAILYFGKTIENRSWGTNYRGRIRIHAAKTWDTDGEHWLWRHGFAPPPYLHMVGRALGGYVGEVTVTDCIPVFPWLEKEYAPWAFGPLCWLLTDPAVYETMIPGRGYPGLYWPERRISRG
jgi:hypothetical protein